MRRANDDPARSERERGPARLTRAGVTNPTDGTGWNLPSTTEWDLAALDDTGANRYAETRGVGQDVVVGGVERLPDSGEIGSAIALVGSPQVPAPAGAGLSGSANIRRWAVLPAPTSCA